MISSELVYKVTGEKARPVKPITLAAAGLRERAHLQEWVIANPEILGEGMLVITSEFDRWVSQAGKDPDRLDVLGLETSGRLVVAELKRDTAPESVSLQAINYAARASRFTPELLAEWGFIRKPTDLVKILGDGELTKSLSVRAHKFSKTAEGKITAQGGSVEVIGG